jgi:lipid II:glycine glycyltransferase (peptidoglycan interpeptide bridge formation enzyme)
VPEAIKKPHSESPSIRISIYKNALAVEETQRVEQFISTNKNNTVFQSPAFFHFYLSLPFYTPTYFIASSGDDILGVMLAVIIREKNPLLSRISARAVVYGGPVLQEDDPDILSLLLDKLNRGVGKKALFTQFRNFRAWNKEMQNAFHKHGFLYRERLNLIVPTLREEEILSGMSSSRRRQIRRGTEAGAIIRPVKDEKEVRQLYGLLSILYREKVRKPLPTVDFFISFYHHLVSKNCGTILVVEAESKIIGGIVCPLSSPLTISELYVCGLDQEYPKYYPSVLATWAGLSYAAAHGIQSFDFMGLGKPEVQYGVRDFKLRFGGDIVNYGRFARRNHKILYAIAETGYNILRQMRKI